MRSNNTTITAKSEDKSNSKQWLIMANGLLERKEALLGCLNLLFKDCEIKTKLSQREYEFLTNLYDALSAGQEKDLLRSLAGFSSIRSFYSLIFSNLHFGPKLKGLLFEATVQGRLPGEAGLTYLHHAASEGRLGFLRALVKFGADVNAKDTNGQTPLHFAAQHGHHAVFRELLARGASPHALDNTGHSPLHVAARAGYLGLTLEPTVRAITIAHKKVVKFDFKAVDGEGRTLLHYAARQGQEYFVERFIREGCHVNARDKAGRTPLHYAVESKNLAMVHYLIEKGSDVNRPDSEGRTPLHYAAVVLEPGIVSALLSKGADREAKDMLDLRPCDLAAGMVRRGVLPVNATLLVLGAFPYEPRVPSRPSLFSERTGSANQDANVDVPEVAYKNQ